MASKQIQFACVRVGEHEYVVGASFYFRKVPLCFETRGDRFLLQFGGEALKAMASNLVASLLLVRPGATSSVLAPSSKARIP